MKSKIYAHAPSLNYPNLAFSCISATINKHVYTHLSPNRPSSTWNETIIVQGVWYELNCPQNVVRDALFLIPQ